MKTRKGLPLWAKILLTVLCALGMLTGGFAGLLYLVLSGTDNVLLLVSGALWVLLFLFAAAHIWRAPAKPVNIAAGSFTALLLVIAGCHLGYTAYVDGIPTIGAEVDLTQYEPFTEGNLLPEPGPASLRLETDLPRLDGATALYPVYAAVTEAVYPEGEYSSYDSIVRCSKTNEAYRRLIGGRENIIFAAGPSDAQLEAAAEAGVELELTPIGREAFVFFVNAKNPVEELTLDQIRGIYSGEIVNWKELGGKNERIRPFQRPADSGSQTALERLMGETPLTEPEQEEIVAGMGGILSKTADYKNFGNAIGCSFRFYASEMAVNEQIRFLRVDGVYPDVSSVRDGSYPLSSEFYAVTVRGLETENTKRLLAWLLSEEGQRLIERVGYLPLA